MNRKKIQFTKMAGAGNDFIVIDSPKSKISLKKLAVQVCDRTNGIGADGLMIFGKSKKSDYQMRIINADGSEAEMCGNGARCMAAYIVANQKPKKKLFSMETMAGEILAEAKGEDAVVRLSNPTECNPDMKIKINDRDMHLSFINTGVPHAVIFVHNLEEIDVKTIGKAVRIHKKFQPKGTNANFIELEKNTLVNVRTYERGVEDETKACGTGSVAAAIIGYLKVNPGTENKKGAKMHVRTTGGEILQVTFDINTGKVSNVWLRGSAKFIAKGEYYV